MAKDAKGHGSEKRGEHSINTVYSSNSGVGGAGKGMYAKTDSGQTFKLNPAATSGMIPKVGSTLDPSQHTAVSAGAYGVAAQHGIPTQHLAPAHSQGIGGVGRTNIDHPVYNTAERPRGYNSQVTPLSADYSTSGRMLRSRMGDFSKDQHVAAGDEHLRQAVAMDAEHRSLTGSAMRSLGGRDPGPLISGIVSDKFAGGTKDRLRSLAQGASAHRAAGFAHYAAAGKRLDTARAALKRSRT